MKNLILVAVVVAFLAVSGTAFAADKINLASGVTSAELQINTAGTANSIKFGLSPKVVARYYNPGTDQPSAQWYGLSTVHPGGTLAWATAQDLNNIYSKDYTTGTTIDTINILKLPSAAASVATWNGLGWSL